MARLLRIGVNALYLIPGGVGGTEIYLRNLLAALAQIDRRNRYFVFVNAETARAEPPLVPAAGNFETVPGSVRAANRPARLAWEQLVLPAQAARRDLDVLFSPGFTSPLWTRARKVTVIHDLQHKRHAENFGWLELAAWRALVWVSARFSQQVVTVSETSRRDILEIYALAPEWVTVVPHGVEPAFFRLREDSAVDRRRLAAGVGDHPYLLSVSTVHPHKNWGRWLEAYRRLAAEGWPHHLVIAGLAGKYSPELRRTLESLDLRERVHVTGWLGRPELLALYKFAEALVFPSGFEGFGMPVLEAMAAGIPVACSAIAPLEETTGEAALLFDPDSVDSMAGAVRKLLSDAELRHRLVEQGRQRAAGFTWTRAAEQTLAVIERAASGPH